MAYLPLTERNIFVARFSPRLCTRRPAKRNFSRFPQNVSALLERTVIKIVAGERDDGGGGGGAIIIYVATARETSILPTGAGRAVHPAVAAECFSRLSGFGRVLFVLLFC